MVRTLCHLSTRRSNNKMSFIVAQWGLWSSFVKIPVAHNEKNGLFNPFSITCDCGLLTNGWATLSKIGVELVVTKLSRIRSIRLSLCQLFESFNTRSYSTSLGLDSAKWNMIWKAAPGFVSFFLLTMESWLKFKSFDENWSKILLRI